MHQVTVEQAKECLRELIEAAINGEDVVITIDGQPVVRLCRSRRAPNGASQG